MTSIEAWLKQVGLEKYVPVFIEHDITIEVLPDLTEADIDRLALPTGPRRRLMVAIRALADEIHASSSAPAANAPAPPSDPHDAERRQLTVMFCDLVGSTALSERLDPEELRELMKAYRKAGGDVVARYDGHVAQYLGDGLMVYFGWPNAHEDDAERCVRAALEIVRAVKGVTAAHPLAVRIGLATGTVVVGESSRAANAEARLAVGDTPNLAARLQGLAGTDEIVIAPATRRLVGDVFDLTDLGTRQLKGIAEPVRVWRVDALRRTEGRFEAAHAGVELTPLVGREEELALLLRAWHQAREGEGRVVLISGEPGIGKSRLAQTLRERIAGEDYASLRYQCSPYHLHSPLYPVIRHIEAMAGLTRDDTAEEKLDKLEAFLSGAQPHRAEVVRLFADLLALPTDRYPALALSPQKQKERTLEALADEIEALSLRRPVLMLVEDVHWIDPTSQEALDLLVSRLHARSVLLVVTYRPEYTPRWAQEAHVTMLSLSRLVRSQGLELISKVTGGRVLPPEILEQIVAHTDGVPLFVEELTKTVLESGLLPEAQARYASSARPPAMAIPTSLRDSLLARLDRLAPVKHILQIGACIGREFSYELLARLAGLSDERLEEALVKLTEAGLVYRRGAPPEAIYTFKHALVQDAAYDSLLKSRRQELHGHLARALELDFSSRVASEPELLGHHYTQAGDLAAAVPWWTEAGNLAVRKVALNEAVVHFQRGLELIEQLPPSPQRDEMELAIREPLNAAWTGLRGWAAAEVTANATAMLELATRLGKSRLMGVGLWAIWVNTITHGRIADSLEWSARLIDEGERAKDLDLQIYGHGADMISQFYLGDLIDAREHGNRVLALYDPQHAARWMKTTASDFKTLVGIWSCQWTWMLGYPDQAVRLSEEKDAYARSLGSAFNLAFALTLGAYAFDYRCEPQRLLERVAEAYRLEETHSVPFMKQVMVPQVEGLAQLRLGELSGAVASLRRGIENWNAGGGNSRVPYLKAALAEALALQGDLQAGLDTIDECLEQIGRPGWQERSHLAEVLRLKGWMLMQQSKGEEAETCLRAAIDWARQQQAKSWELRAATTLAQLLAERGQRDAGRWLLAPIYDWFTEGFDTRDLRAARSLLEALR